MEKRQKFFSDSNYVLYISRISGLGHGLFSGYKKQNNEILYVALSNIQEFVETTIVLKKDKKNELGISIAGGSDSYLEQICVIEVHRDGIAFSDGRLRKGDVILAVNDISFREATLADAVRCLKETPSPVRLIILRENPQALFTTNERFGINEFLFQGRFSIAFGLQWGCLLQQPGSIAARHGRRISQGDQILEINGHNVRESNQKDVAHMIQNLDGAIVLLLGRVPALYSSIQEWVKWKAQQCLRTRTSTWSSYTANTKEKLQVQRPSLPVSKESPALGFANTIATVIATVMPDLSNVIKSPCHSPSSSLRRSRLSIPEDTSKYKRDGQRLVEEFKPTTSTASDKPRVPSILVTSF
ncbi:multiple PDZ domain protein [Trichonephila inaurata madagascariensis]|uniref:Multiple PDZ domain protein n=1 Tax=Trichonephila inaurata madagascariensis TaxID=2747483 RepID=A0A8X6XRX2_9ARAC|nr:multiple PDZ domain protein [Trichonephila inaurata madagascariensis]